MFKTAAVIGALVVSSLAAPAMAADLPVRVPAAIPQAAPAPIFSGFYVGLRGGLNWMQDTSFAALPGVTVFNEYDAGWTISGAVGYQFGPVLGAVSPRVEAEVGILRNEIDRHGIPALGVAFSGANAFGRTSATFGLVNAYFDLPIAFGPGSLRPFVGGGIGAAEVRFRDHGTSATGVVMSSSDTVFAWNLATGVAYDLSNGFSVEGMYRYLRFEDVNLRSVAGASSNTDVENHQLMLGVRYRF